MNNTKQTSGNRFWLIVALLVLLVFFATLLYFRSKNIEGFKESYHYVFEDSNLNKVDSCISILYLAENNSRLYILTKDTSYFNIYHTELMRVKEITLQLDQILKDAGDHNAIAELLDKKIEISQRLVKLSLYADSLLQLSNHARERLVSEVVAIPKYAKLHLQPILVVDTVVEVTTEKAKTNVKKKGLLKRLANAISNKNQAESLANKVFTTKYIHKKIALDTSIESVVYNKKQLENINQHYLKYIHTKPKLDNEQAEMLQLNEKIFRKYKTVLMDLRNIIASQQNLHADKFKNRLQITIDQFGLNATGLITIIALLSFIVVVNLRNLYRDERALIAYSERVQEYANHNKEFLANMSHELRTPLNSIIGFSEQLGKKPLEAQSAEYVSAIHTSSSMLLGIVNDILDFSRLELDKVSLIEQSFNLKQLIQDLTATIEIQAQNKGLSLHVDLGNINSNTILSGDAFRIKQILLNLLSNAIKYTQKGSVHLKTHIEQKEHQKVMFHAQIKDTGIGIKEKYLDLIFDKFAQISDAEFTEWQTGTGLGLAITKRIVQLFGGTIHVESKINEGSEFTIQLPLKVSNVQVFEHQQVTERRFQFSDFKGIKVLLVDDNLMNIKLASLLLKKWNIQFDVAYDGHEAFELFQQKQYQLLLTDVQMPVMNGVELTKAIRNYADVQKSNMVIVGITANVLKNDIQGYISAGMNDILLKPYTEEEYLLKVLLGKPKMG